MKLLDCFVFVIFFFFRKVQCKALVKLIFTLHLYIKMYSICNKTTQNIFISELMVQLDVKKLNRLMSKNNWNVKALRSKYLFIYIIASIVILRKMHSFHILFTNSGNVSYRKFIIQTVKNSERNNFPLWSNNGCPKRKYKLDWETREVWIACQSVMRFSIRFSYQEGQY